MGQRCTGAIVHRGPWRRGGLLSSSDPTPPYPSWPMSAIQVHLQKCGHVLETLHVIHTGGDPGMPAGLKWRPLCNRTAVRDSPWLASRP